VITRTRAPHPAVVNIDLAQEGVVSKVEAAIETLVDLGYPAVTGANDEGKPPCDWSPGRMGPAMGGVVTVGGIGRGDVRWSGSGHGRCVKIFAPAAGLDLASTDDPDARAVVDAELPRSAGRLDQADAHGARLCEPWEVGLMIRYLDHDGDPC